MKKLISGLILLMASFLVFAENTAIDLAVEAMEKQDYETAKKLFEPEASKGNEYALAYKYGRGSEANLEKAIYWFKKGSENGDCDAQYNLGVTYIEQKDYKQSLYYYTLAAEQGDQDAIDRLEQLGMN